MVTRQNLPDHDAEHTPEELRERLRERSLEVEELRARVQDLENLGAGFLSDASHAIMNPLTIIQSYLEIIISDLPDGLSSDQIGFLETAQIATHTMRRMIDDLVEYAALETGTAEFELESVELKTIVDEVFAVNAPAAREAELEFLVSADATTPPVSADAARLKHAIGALVSNAIRVTPGGGRILITVSHSESQVVVEVADTGPGIPDDQQIRIFEAFARLPRHPSEPNRGAGLGLAVAKKQIECLGGRLDVVSTVDRGSTFSIRLPTEMTAG